jgi:hypothetical protein
VACSLPAGDLTDRAAAWREVIAGAVAAEIPDGVRLTLPASRASDNVSRATAIAGLAAAEQECCPFLDFRLHLDGTALHLEVRAPAGARDLLADLLTPARSSPQARGQEPQSGAACPATPDC